MTARDRIVAGVVACAALLGGFWFLVLSPRSEEAKQLSAQIATERQRLDAARASAAAAETAQRSYAADYATVARLGKAVPEDDGVASLVFQLESAAQSAGVDFRKLRLDAQAGAATTAPAPPAAGAAQVAKEGAGDPAAPSAQPVAATHTASAGLPPGAKIGPAGFPVMPFSFVFDGSFFDLHEFLRELDRFTTLRGEELRVRGRLLTLNGISLTAGRKGFPQVKAAISANAYLVPAGEGATAGATPSAPAAPGQPQSGGTTLPTPTATVVP